MMHAGCPITWKSQLQTEFTLSSTESEHAGLSCALREAIPVMELLNEMKANGFKLHAATPEVHCKAFEDNSGALEMARAQQVSSTCQAPKLLPASFSPLCRTRVNIGASNRLGGPTGGHVNETGQ